VRTISRLAVKFMAGIATKGSSAKPQLDRAVERQKRQNESDASSANYDRRRIGAIAVAIIVFAVALAWTVATIVIAIIGIESLRSL
jgi:hypothetical protein